MRKKLLILLMAVAFAAASLMPATVSAQLIKAPVCHNGHSIEVDPNSLAGHIGHGDTLGDCVP